MSKEEPFWNKEEIIIYVTTKQGKKKKITFTSRKPIKKEAKQP